MSHSDLQNAFSAAIVDPSLLNIEVEVPPALRPVLAANRHLMPKFAMGVTRSVQASFEHPDTRLRGEIRQSEVRQRVHFCYEALRQMYYEEKLSLLHALDILPQVLVDALRMGQGSLSELIEGQHGNSWGVAHAPSMTMTSDGADLNAEE